MARADAPPVRDPAVRRLLRFLGLVCTTAGVVLLLILFYNAFDLEGADGGGPRSTLVLLALALFVVGGMAGFLAIHRSRA